VLKERKPPFKRLASVENDVVLKYIFPH